MFRFYASGLRDYDCPPWEHRVIRKKAGSPKLWVIGWDCEYLTRAMMRAWRVAFYAMISERVAEMAEQMRASRERLADWLFTRQPDTSGSVSIRSFLINPRRPEAIK